MNTIILIIFSFLVIFSTRDLIKEAKSEKETSKKSVLFLMSTFFVGITGTIYFLQII